MEKINIAELLKDCPKGMELDCLLFNDVIFDGLDDDEDIPILIRTKEGETWNLSNEGCWDTSSSAKCVIFPKGKTTWEGFQRPFKDGDIVAFDSVRGAQVFIFNEYIDANDGYAYCYVMLDDDGSLDFELDDYYVTRFATEEEKQKLFDAIKANGYKWNEETKTLEKLVEPKFKVGDKVRHKNNHNVVFTITGIEEDSYVCGAKMAFWFDDQDGYELVPNKFDITTLKPFDKVLVRDKDKVCWRTNFYELYNEESESYHYRTVGGMLYKQCIPYEGNEHLLGKTDDCDEFYKTWE